MIQSKFFMTLFFIAIAVVSRFMPHPPNFTPLLAISLFAGSHLKDWKYALLVPFGAMFVSDLFLGIHTLMPVVYGYLFLMVWLGRSFVKEQVNWKLAVSAIGGSVGFFVVSNFFVWLTSGMYSLNTAGLVDCYVMAIPFFQWSLLGDIAYTAVMFGGLAFMETAGWVYAQKAEVRA